jgi:hypothetical protein
MGRLLPAVVAAMFLVAACGDDSGDDSGSGDDSASATSSTSQPDESGDDTAASGGTASIEEFCEAYRSAQMSAENAASTDQFRDITPPEELEAVWSDYLDSDFDAGVTVDGFVTENCFDDLTSE